ncbi:MAG: sigma-70 family RNA polymerase sigma factor [Planctomycetota bacterium]
MNRPNDSPKDREQQYDEFVVLLAKHDLPLRRYVRALMPSPDGVDDVLQETALECWKKYSDFQPIDSQEPSEDFLRWACVIARFKALSWQRDRSRDRLVFRESVIELLSSDALRTVLGHEEERRAVSACLQELSVEQRRLVLSVHSPGESVARIARETGQQTRRLYHRVNALRDRLLKCVEQRLAGEAADG